MKRSQKKGREDQWVDNKNEIRPPEGPDNI